MYTRTYTYWSTKIPSRIGAGQNILPIEVSHRGFGCQSGSPHHLSVPPTRLWIVNLPELPDWYHYAELPLHYYSTVHRRRKMKNKPKDVGLVKWCSPRVVAAMCILGLFAYLHDVTTVTR